MEEVFHHLFSGFSPFSCSDQDKVSRCIKKDLRLCLDLNCVFVVIHLVNLVRLTVEDRQLRTLSLNAPIVPT